MEAHYGYLVWILHDSRDGGVQTFELHYINYINFSINSFRIVLFALPSKIPSVRRFPSPSLEHHRPMPWPFPCS